MSENTEGLISSIEKRPCLWDINDNDYHNRDLKDLAWEQVCKEVIDDWEMCTDKKNKCADLKKKWTHIRDYYRRDLQKIKTLPTGSAAKKQKKYVYADMLYFLAPIFDKRNSEGNYQTDDSDTTQLQFESEKQNEQTPIQEDNNIMQPPLEVPPVQKPQKKKDVPSQILNMLKQRDRPTQQTNYKEEDDDTKFLLSFRTYMKHMNVTQKLDFQVGMLQLVKQITSGSGPSSSRLNSDYYYSDNSSVSLSSPENPCNVSYTSVPVPQSSPIVYYTSSQASSVCSSTTSQRNVKSNPRIIINSIRNLPTHQPTQSYLQQAEDSNAARFLEEESIGQYLKFNK